MPKRTKNFSRSRIVSQRQKMARKNETSEEREARLTLLRENYQRNRSNQTEEQLENYRETHRIRERSRRRRETSAQTDERRNRNRERMSNLRRNEQIESQLLNTTVHNVRERRRGSYSLEHEAFHYDPNKNYNEHLSVVIGRMDQVCKFCKARKFKGETPSTCCSSGKIKLLALNLPPPEFFQYMNGETQKSKDFLQKIRSYNACFQMTSFGATAIVEEEGFKSVFKVQGQIYHKIGSLLPLPNETPKFLQVYFLGNEEDEVDQRLSNFTELRREIIFDIQRFLHENNELVRIFKTAMEKMISDDYKIIIRADKKPISEHERRFNTPQVNEVAVVIVDNEKSYRDIVVQRRSNKLERIAETHRLYDALQYPLIFWQGEDGYHFNIQQINPETNQPTNKKVSSKEFYAYRIMKRENEYNHILNCRQLFSQFIVDMQAKIEAERLLYIRRNQSKLRTDEYIHLRDAVANDGDIENLGKLVILPSTFTGSPRHMFEYAQDAMTYVRKYGRPDLFITFTCNPSWKEINDELEYGQRPYDRHDIIARVFKEKQVKFINIIVKSRIFGDVICWMYSIEWQKRGLPHSHNLIWLREKIHSNQIDNVIKAEFPNPVEDPVLYQVIVQHMIHGPCGGLNIQSPCMKDNKCSKRYPRSFLSATETGEDGYPKYRRRPPSEGGFTAKIKIRGKEVEIDNQWVVPYNPLLSKMFQAHINVEYCSSVKSIKYVCKYINKGSDMAVFGITDGNRDDEILRYQLGRYINSNEAVWRILGFPIHDRDPAVFHLAVHLENGQRVYFTNQTAQKVANQPVNTTLTAFFELCQNDPFAKTLLYIDVPNYYTWDPSRKIFNRRKRGVPVEGFEGVFKDNAIGRVYTVHPKNAECFYLRLLLHEIRGPTSFQDLRTVDGYICETYREACQRRGLLENDNHWEQAMREAVQLARADQVRELFAIILTSCNPSNPNRLWLKYRDSMSDDILARIRRDNPDLDITFNEDIYNEALIILEDRCLMMSNQSLVQLGVQSPVRSELDVVSSELTKELNYNMRELQRYIKENEPKLTQTQRIIYNTIMNRIETDEGGIIFLDAPGGTGKTFLINLVLAAVRVKKEIALALASSGIAATLMEGGKTAHSALNLPLNVADQEYPVCNITRSSARGKILMRCKIIIWDECTMAHKKSIEALNRTLQDLRKNTRLMGGILLLLSGDFRQTLPVIPKSTPADEINACLKRLIFWNSVDKLSLTENMRAIITGDPKAQTFAKNLLKIGNGTYPLDSHSGKLILTEELCNVVDTEEQLIEKVYPFIEKNYQNKTWLYERAILATRNDVVQQINEKIQSMIPGVERIYKSIDTMMNQDESVNFPTEFLNSLNPPGMSSHILKLKIGSPVILLRNLNSPKLCNGTRLCVKQMLDNIIEAVILTGKDTGNSVFIPRIPLISNDLPFCFKRLQFPLKLAYSMTINKAQGQTFQYCGVNLQEPCFSHGQLYVAFSRVGQAKNLFVYAPENKTSNVVYKNIL